MCLTNYVFQKNRKSNKILKAAGGSDCDYGSACKDSLLVNGCETVTSENGSFITVNRYCCCDSDL